MITINKLSKKFSGTPVLENINYTFHAGQVYGIMGENGAGKTTLFRCLMGLEKYEGSIIKQDALKVGYLYDTPFYYSFVTGMEYIIFCLKARKIPVNKQKILKLNEKFALPLERYATQYSLGMKKRLMIMTIMLQDNDFILMDEPFNGLDLTGTILLKKWISSMREQGKCLVLSSHIISALTDVCDEISYIHQGKIVANYSGRTAEEIEKEISDSYLNL